MAKFAEQLHIFLPAFAIRNISPHAILGKPYILFGLTQLRMKKLFCKAVFDKLHNFIADTLII